MNFKKLFVIMKEHIKCLWYLVLLILTTCYLSFIHNDIIFLWPLTKITTIFILWILLLIFPLFSEIEFGSFKLKKEIEKTREDIRKDIGNLQNQILNNNNSVYVGCYAAGKDELNNMAKMLKNQVSMRKSSDRTSNLAREEVADTHHDGKIDVDKLDPLSYVAHVRVNIEKSLREICVSLNYVKKRNGSFLNIGDMLKFLYDSKIINNSILSSITQVQIIANRSLHGELIDNEYLDFIKNIYPLILEELNRIKNNLYNEDANRF